MKKHSWSFKDAIAYLRRHRPSVCPNLGFERQLKEYEITLLKGGQPEPPQPRFGSKTSEERKHAASPQKQKMLPEIGVLARTQLKPKLLDLFSLENEKQSSQRSRRSSSDRPRQ